MSFMQALLLALWAGFCSYDDQGPQMLRRPLLIGPVVGLILGDLQTALIVSATLELMWMGLGNMAGYRTPDMIIGTIVGISVAVTTGNVSDEGIAAGVAAATAVAVLAQQLITVFDFVKQFFIAWADKIALSGDFDGLMKINIVSVMLQFLIRAVPTFLVVYFQGGVVEMILERVPAEVLAGLGVASRLLPAVGLSLLMTMMMKGFLWPFLIFGFTISTYGGLDVLPVTLIAIAIAMLYTFMMEMNTKIDEGLVPKGSGVGSSGTKNEDFDEDGGYDL